jgi:GNAT superfamily N-acetyltransferase
MMSSSLVIRRATIEDFDAISELPTVYSGHDYLPFLLKAWLLDENRTSLIALDGKRVVAFDSVYPLLDNGKTIISQALRVDPEFQGQGISSRLQTEIESIVSQSSAQRVRVTTYAENHASLNLHVKRGFVQLADVFCGPKGALEPVVERLGQFRALAGDVVVEPVPDSSAPPKFPNVAVMLTDWVPFDPTPAGLESVNRLFPFPVQFVVSKVSGTVSHYQFSRAKTELYASIYDGDDFWAHFHHHLTVAAESKTVKYVAFHCLAVTCRERLVSQAALIDEAFAKDAFNSSFSDVLILQKDLQ